MNSRLSTWTLILAVGFIVGCKTQTVVKPSGPPSPPGLKAKTVAPIPRSLGNRIGVPLTNAVNVGLAWNPSVSPDVVGYKIYQGPASRTYSTNYNAGNTTNFIVAVDAGSTNFFAATAYTSAGLESPFSTEASYVAPLPTPPSTGAVYYVNTTVETNSDLKTWTPAAQYQLAITNAPGLFFRARLSITVTNQP